MKPGGVVFGGIFFLAGLAVFYFFVLSTLLDAFQMLNWQSVNADLQSAEISSYESRNDNGSYTTMYSVAMSYEYWVAGRSYYGDRADIQGYSSSDSDTHYQRLYKIKQEAGQNRLRVWVNPDDPTQSIYDLSVDIKMMAIMTLFSGVFMFVGGGIIAISRKDKAPLPANVMPDPRKPWTTRAQWASATILSNAKNKVGLIKFFSILSVMFFGMFAIALFGEGPVATGFAVAMCLPPFFLFRWYKKKKAEWDHFQKVPVNLSPYPGLIGGKVAGNILVPQPYAAGDQYTFTLKCTHHWVTRSGNERRHNSSLLWSNTFTPKPKAKINGTYLTFEFDVPADKPQSSEPDSNYHTWTLEITSQLNGINFQREYEIPVFITEDSKTVEDELIENPLTTEEKTAIHDRLNIQKPPQVTSNIEPDALDDTLSFHTPGDKTGWIFAAMGGVFFIVGMAIAIIGGSAFGYAFATVASLFIAIGVFIAGRNCKVQVSHSGIIVDVFLFSRYIKRHMLPPDNITEIKAVKSSSTSTNGKQSYERYGLNVITRYSHNIDLGGEFKSMKNATHIKLKIEAILKQGD